VPPPKTEVHESGTERDVLMKVKPSRIASNCLGVVVSNSNVVKRISERPDIKSAHIEGRDTRSRSWIRLNISRE